MTTTAHKSNFGYRLGNWTRRMLARLNGFEIGVAQRMQGVLPRFGYTLTRGAFLLVKLAALVALLVVSVWVLLSILMLAVLLFFIAGLGKGQGNAAPEDDDSYIDTMSPSEAFHTNKLCPFDD